MKSIKTKIMTCMTLVVTISLLIIGSVSIYLNLSSTNETLRQTMTEAARVAAESVSKELAVYKTLASEAGSIQRLSSATTGKEEKLALLAQRAQTYGLTRGDMVDTAGISLSNGMDFSDRAWFQDSLAGASRVSEPLTSKVTGERTIVVSAPLWERGVPNTRVVGVVYFVPKEGFLDEMVRNINVSPSGAAQILDRNDNIVAHPSADRRDTNAIEEAKTNPELHAIAALEADQIKGNIGFGTYSMKGVEKFLAYAPIGDTNGWSIGVNAPIGDFMEQTTLGVIITVVLLVVSIAAANIIAVMLATAISRPVSLCAKRMQQLAAGDLASPVPSISGKDETAALAGATAALTESFGRIIKDIDYCLSEMADGNFAASSQEEDCYIGDFHSILLSIRDINSRLSGTLSQINQTADLVSAGAEQVSGGSQSLSLGTTEQASSIQELAATINEISAQVKQNASHARLSSDKAGAIGEQVARSDQQMQEMMRAMDEISGGSEKIGKIIKTIEDIAFQTNILALNAAVEAARAGAAGKGFAVVADEVRNLASKSSEAAKSTTSLIEGSIRSVSDGTRIAGETAEFLQSVVENVGDVVTSIGAISKANQQQADSIYQVTTGVDQISSVVQNNSATAEQSAAASEELSGQAQALRDLIRHFRLGQHGNDMQTDAPVSAPAYAETDAAGNKY